MWLPYAASILALLVILLGGALLVLLVFFRRERRDLQAQAERAYAALERTRRLRATGTLADGVAHDFNNALTAILGYSEMAREQLDDQPESLKMLGEIIKAGQNARDITRRLLNFSRRTTLEIQPLPLSFVLRDMRNILRAATPSCIEVVSSSTQQEGYVMADSNQLLMVVVVITSWFTGLMRPRKSGTIALEASLHPNREALVQHGLSPQEGYVALTVSGDVNDLLPPPRACDPFTAFTPMHEHSPDGGLDLAATRSVMEAMQGAIYEDKTAGKGLRFTLLLPQPADQRHGS